MTRELLTAWLLALGLSVLIARWLEKQRATRDLTLAEPGPLLVNRLAHAHEPLQHRVHDKSIHRHAASLRGPRAHGRRRTARGPPQRASRGRA